MNNYCTNCGKKLKRKELVCENCNVAIVNLPYDSNYVSPKTKKKRKKIQKYCLIIIGAVLVVALLMHLHTRITSKKLLKEYVQPYVEKNYGNYNIEYESSGKCIIAGNCYSEPVIECDGNGCDLYEYLSRFECRSYFYNIYIGNDEKLITVFYRIGKYNVVEGRNIYGISDEYDEYE